MDQRFNILSRLCLVGVLSLALSAGCVQRRTGTFKVALVTPARDSIVAGTLRVPRFELVADSVPVVAGR